MDKNAEIQRDRKGSIIYDKETKDTEQVKWEENIEDYMAREVLPHIPDAAAFFEENLGAKKPVIKPERRSRSHGISINISLPHRVRNLRIDLKNWSYL